jgi:hypothetical protein
MYIYILFSLLILVLLLTRKKINYLLSWIIITIFSAIRFDVGNDYYYYYAISTQAGKNEYAKNYWFSVNYDLKYNFFKFLSDIYFYFIFLHCLLLNNILLLQLFCILLNSLKIEIFFATYFY